MRMSQEEKKQRLQLIHDYIEKNGSAHYGELAKLLDLGPSAAMAWAKLATYFFEDLEYKGGVLRKR